MSVLFSAYRERLPKGEAVWIGSTLKCAALTGLISQTAIDEFVYLSEIATPMLPTRSNTLTGLDIGTGVQGGLALCNDILFPNLNSFFSEVQSFIIYEDTGDDATSSMVAYLDDGVILPFVALGGDVTLTPPFGTGFFRV